MIRAVIIIIFLGFLGFITNKSYAQPNCPPVVPPPVFCPSISFIIAQGISTTLSQDGMNNWFGGFLFANLGTMQKWTFIFGGIQAADRATAYNLLQAALPTLTFSNGPIFNGFQYFCHYNNAAGFAAMTITPPIGCQFCWNPQ